jgi:ABC-type iron transport system FetAB ATPase subunit
MKTEEIKKQDELKDEQLDNVSGGVKANLAVKKKLDFNPKLP